MFEHNMTDQQYLPGFFQEPHDILAQAVAAYNPVAAGLLFSGGHDSVCVVDIAYQYLKDKMPVTVVHIDTGMGIRRTRQYVERTAEARGWPLKVYKSAETYEDDIVPVWGFPGPAMHKIPYRALKDRCIDQFVREKKVNRKSRVLLVTGERLHESKRRMGNGEPMHRKGAKAWVSPILYWMPGHKNWYMKEHNIPRNEVVDCMHMSGECLCGAFARDGELDEWRFWFPDEPVLAKIAALEVTAAELGKEACKWGQRPGGKRRLPKLEMCSHCEMFEQMKAAA
jgi:3'-phosphoadenosine 5'-phosphosulfate sulfotransferase (PAPS reductase)/FAD synthetase